MSVNSAELAAFKVGEFHEHGWGGAEQGEGLAKGFYQRAGAVGAPSVHRLEEGDRNRAEVERLTAAAEAGDAHAQLQLGRVLEYGQLGAAVDKGRAEGLYRLSAEAGYSQAQYQLGLFLIRQHVLRYLKLAADQGHGDASYCLTKLSWCF